MTIARSADMAGVNRPESLPEVIEQLKSRVRALETATPLRSASIGSGGLTINDGGHLNLNGGQIQVNGVPIPATETQTHGDAWAVVLGTPVNQSVTVLVPDWAESAHVMASGIAVISGAAVDARAFITIDGDSAPWSEAISDDGRVVIPTQHVRSWAPSVSFDVEISANNAGGSPVWDLLLQAVVIFSDQPTM
jgi:hypothetical protein